MKPHAVAGLLFLTLTACRADSAPVPDVSVRDSAGIRIVEYGAVPSSLAPFAFASRPLYTYGAGPEDYPFQGVWRGVLLPDGSAAVVDAFNREIVLLTPEGALRGLLAGPGDGPGELNRPGELFPLGGDSLLVEDRGHGRFTIFAGGEVVREVDTRFLNRALRARGLDAAGRMLMTSASFLPGFTEPWLQGHMARFAMDSGVVDTVAAYDWEPASPREGPTNPFGRGGYVTVTAGSFVYMRTDTPAVVWRNHDGTVQQIVRWRAEPAYPDEEDWRLFESSLRARLRPANPQVQSEAEFEDLMQRSLARYELMSDVPLPLFNRLFGDREGRLWLGHWAAGASLSGVARYSILATDGLWLGEVEAPERVRILDVAGSRVLGVARDELGVESVVVYELLSGEPEESA